ncbi:hypothetical protein ACIGO9_30670 [Nocardia asteroides]|uniref:hypothetical protein n=1 Tax=Nocardia asteroides TaxID=1824 RepID=UPI0037C999D6
MSGSAGGSKGGKVGILFRVEEGVAKGLEARLSFLAAQRGVAPGVVRGTILSDVAALLVQGGVPVSVLPELKHKATQAVEAGSEAELAALVAELTDLCAQGLADAVLAERSYRRSLGAADDEVSRSEAVAVRDALRSRKGGDT